MHIAQVLPIIACTSVARRGELALIKSETVVKNAVIHLLRTCNTLASVLLLSITVIKKKQQNKPGPEKLGRKGFISAYSPS